MSSPCQIFLLPNSEDSAIGADKIFEIRRIHEYYNHPSANEMKRMSDVWFGEGTISPHEYSYLGFLKVSGRGVLFDTRARTDPQRFQMEQDAERYAEYVAMGCVRKHHPQVVGIRRHSEESSPLFQKDDRCPVG